MSLNSILSSSLSGMSAAQTQLRVVSDNVANINTPGYVRKIADQISRTSDGVGVGTDISRIRLSTDRFLQAATLNAQSSASRASVRSELYDRVQSLFGDPSEDSSLFGQVDALFSSFAAIGEDSLSSPRRQAAVMSAKQVFDEANRISTAIQAVRTDADSRITSAVDNVNQLLGDIESLNLEISRASVGGRDTSGAETAQAQLIDKLSALMDVRIAQRPVGGVTLRTNDGVLLAGDGSAKLSYSRAGVASAQTVFNEVWITPPGGVPQAMLDHLGDGELKGLIDMRDVDAPQAAERLAELTSQIADQLNRAHNAYSAFPAPATMTGKDTGLDLESAISGFSGATTIALVDSSGILQRRVDIDFDAGTMSVDGGASTGFSPASFLSDLNSALGGMGSATFTNRGLSLSATGGNGVAVQDSATNPADNGGRGFSWYFGLNDLVRSDQPATYETGLSGTDAHGFTPGDTVTFRFSNDAGSKLRDITVAVPAGGTMDDLLAELNSTSTGVGRFGAFSLDAQGKLSFSASVTPPPTMAVVDDKTSRGAGGPSLSKLFGIGAGTRASRADSFTIRDDIYRSPGKLALSKLDLGVSAGTPVLAAADGRGARAMADAGEAVATFDAAGGAMGGDMTVTRYLADLAGDIGAKAAATVDRQQAASTLLDAAASRRSSYEGVNLDEELVKLTTYQQAYNASARMIQAAKELYDVLLGMTK
jgi:flagellar hook-associated protein 1 FlgK